MNSGNIVHHNMDYQVHEPDSSSSLILLRLYSTAVLVNGITERQTILTGRFWTANDEKQQQQQKKTKKKQQKKQQTMVMVGK